MDNLIKESRDWIAERPYLKGIGELHIAIYEAIGCVYVKPVAKPDTGAFKKSMDKGVPFFEAAGTDFLDFEAMAKIFAAVTRLHKNERLPEKFRNECLAVEKACEADPKVYERLIKDMLKADGKELNKFATEKSVNADLLTFFTWISVRGELRPYLKDLAEAEKAWVFGHCPTCGSEASVASLIHTNRGRERFLFCAHCGCRWSYKRIGCPYCDNDDPKTLGVKEIDGEKSVRLDFCDKCKSYIKTCVDKSNSDVILEDWATAHIDILFDGSEYKKHGGLFVWK